MNRFFLIIFCFTYFLVISNFAFSVYTKTYEIEFSQTNLQDFLIISNVSFLQGGEGLSLSLPVVNIYKGPESFVSSAIYSGGGIIFSTVNPNNLYSWVNGNIQLSGSFPDHSIITKLKKLDDEFFVLTGENGAVYFVNKNGNVKKVLEVNGYVWDLFKLNNEYFIITGNPAKLYKFSLDGNVQLIFENRNEKHFLCSLVSDKIAYIGASGTGTIYRFDGKKVESFLSLPEGEITSLDMYSGDLVVSTYDILQSQVKPQQSQQQDQKQQQSILPSADSIGKIYRISANGRKKVLITQNGISDFEIVSNTIIAITSDGKLIEFDLTDEKFMKISFYNDNFIRLVSDGNDLLILTGVSAGVRMISKSSDQIVGLIETKEINLGDVHKIGRISVDSMLPSDSYVKIYIKGGNSPLEDNTWSDWLEVNENESLSTKGITNMNFIKLKFIIRSKYPSMPLMKSARIYYSPKNSEPIIRNATCSLKDNNINVEWDCYDPDDDNLVYDVFVREYKSTEWQKINTLPISDQKFSISKYLIGDGFFDIKVVASDESSNPTGFAKTNFYIIRNIIVDITPPYLDLNSFRLVKLANSKQAIFRFVDNLVLKELKYSIDGINWYYILPDDGVIDSSVESFKIELPINAKVLILQIKDSQGNIKVERVNL